MIGVCIKFFHENYGGMLQAYATVSLLEELGFDYELIRYQKKRTTVEKIRSLPRLLNAVLLNDKYEALIKKVGEKMHPDFAEKNAQRIKAFQRFNQTHFTRLSPVFVGYADLCQGANRYTSVISGSDQLWSPAGLPTNYYNLMFVPEDVHKVSFASSFGVSTIPWYQRRRTKEYLDRIPQISMRENRGAEIVQELTGRSVPVLMDPVFSFDKEQWEKLIPPEASEYGKYIFCYFLGDNLQHRAAARELAEKTGLKIVTLRHLDRYVAEDETFGDYAPYDVSPDKFLNLLRNAEYVLTDSFHGTAFSIIHEKQFLVFNRYNSASSNSKNSRIDSLCANLGLEDRRYVSGCDVDREIDYTRVNRTLREYREKTVRFLREALDNRE